MPEVREEDNRSMEQVIAAARQVERIAELEAILRDARAVIENPMQRIDKGYGPAGPSRRRTLEAIDKAL